MPDGSTPAGRPGLRFAYFRSKNDNQARHSTLTWDAFCGELAKPAIRAEKDGPLFSPATFKPAKRAKANVVEVAALVLDYDHQASLAEDIARWSDAGHAFAAYTSHSHGRTLPNNPQAEDRFRLVLPLAAPVPAALFPALWDWAWQQSGNRIDKAAKDASRIYYRPARHSKTAPYEQHVADGPWLDWRALGLSADACTGVVALDKPVVAPPAAAAPGRTAYGETALQDWLGKLCLAKAGARNDTLNKAAYYLGQCVGGGHL